MVNTTGPQIAPPKSIGRMTTHASARVNQLANKLLAPHDLSLQQWVVLNALWQHDGMSVGMLCKFSNNALPAMSRLTDRMELAGWLEKRVNAKDKRATQLFLTEKGEGKRGLSTFYVQINEILMAGMTEGEQDLLFDLLGRLHDNAANALLSDSED